MLEIPSDCSFNPTSQNAHVGQRVGSYRDVEADVSVSCVYIKMLRASSSHSSFLSPVRIFGTRCLTNSIFSVICNPESVDKKECSSECRCIRCIISADSIHAVGINISLHVKYCPFYMLCYFDGFLSPT